MRFEFYNPNIEKTPKLSIDGTVPHSIHFSHWEGNETPESVKADTSTEIALNLVAAPNKQELTQGIDLVTNNHFDTDGVLSVWTVLTGEPALELVEQLVGAAEAGDFSEFPNEQAVRASIVIQGPDQAGSASQSGSPLANHLAGKPVDNDKAYRLVLPEVPRVLKKTNDFEPLWRDAWEILERALNSFASGRSKVAEYSDARLSLVTLEPEIFSAAGLDPTKHGPPVTAISTYAHGDLFLIATPARAGWVYRLDYPYYSWAETVVRPTIPRRDLAPLLINLNALNDNPKASWQIDNSEMTSAAKFLNDDGSMAVLRQTPDEIFPVVRASLVSTESSAAGV